MRPFFQMPADGWYNIAIAGEFPHSTGYVQVLDSDAFKAIVQDVHEQMGKPNWPGILVDFDHDSLDPARPSTAAGWLTDIEERPDGLWAQIRWSDTGQKALEGGMFRFVSPVWLVDDCEDLGNKRLRPRRLMNCAVTNAPNIKGMCPLTNRDTSADKPRLSPAGRPLPIVDRVTVPIAGLRAIEGDVLENARRPLTEKQKRFLWAQSTDHGGSPYQTATSRSGASLAGGTAAGREAAKKGGSASDIIAAQKGAKDSAKRYHDELQEARDHFRFKENEARNKQEAKVKASGKPEKFNWTLRDTGARKKGKKLKANKKISSDPDARRGDRQDKVEKLFAQAASDFNNRTSSEKRRKFANASRSPGAFLANTAWDDMTDTQRRWWWAQMGGRSGSPAVNPYTGQAATSVESPWATTGTPINPYAQLYSPDMSAEESAFWREVYGNANDPNWQPTEDLSWLGGTSSNDGLFDDDAWAAHQQFAAGLNQQLRDAYAEAAQMDKVLTPAQRDALSYLSDLGNDWTTDFGAGALKGFGNLLDTTSNFFADAATGWFDLADLGVKLLGLDDTAVGDFAGSVHSGVHSLVDPVNNWLKDKTGINWAVQKLGEAYDDLGRTGDWADVTSKMSSGVFVAAATMALGLLGQAAKGTANLAKFKDALTGGTLNPLNPFHTPVSIPKPGVGVFEIAEIKPTKKQLDEILRKAFDVESRHVFPEGIGYMEERATMRSFEEALSALTDIGRDTYTGQVKAFEEALESWRNAYSGSGLASKLRAAERSRVRALGELPTNAAERSAIEEAAYAREMWGMPDAQANAAYSDDLARLASDGARRKFGDSMGRDVFEKAATKEELARTKAGALTKPPAAAVEAGTAAPAPATGEEAIAALRAKMSERGASQAEWDQLGEWEARVRSEIDRLSGQTPVAEAVTAPAVPVTSAAEAEARSAWRQFGDDFADALDEALNGDWAQRPGAGPLSKLGAEAEDTVTTASLDDALAKVNVVRETPPKIGETGTLPGIPANTGKPLGKAGIPPPGHTGSYHPDMPREGETLASYFERTGYHSANPEWRNPNVSDSTYLSGIAEGLEYPNAADFKKAESLVYPASWAKASAEAKWKAAHSVHVNPFYDTSRGDIYEALRSVDGEAVFPRPTPKTTGTVSPEVAAQVREMEIRSDMRRFQDRAQVLSEAKRRSILESIFFPSKSDVTGSTDIRTLAGIGTGAALLGSLPFIDFSVFKSGPRYVVVPEDSRTRTAELSSPPPASDVPYSPDGQRLWYHAYDTERDVTETPAPVVPFRVQDESGALLDAKGRVRGFADGTEVPAPDVLASAPSVMGTRTWADNKPHPHDAIRAQAVTASGLEEALAAIKPEYVTVSIPIPPSTPTDEQVALVRQNAGGAAKETAAGLKARIDQLEQERAALESRSYAVPIPEKRPEEYQNLQAVRASAMVAGGTSQSVLEAVNKAQRQNSDVSRLKAELRKATKGVRSARERERAEAEVLARFNAAHNDAVQQNATNDKLAAKRLARIDRELESLNRAYRYATERAENAETRAEERLKSKTLREAEKAQRALERAQREADRKARFDAKLKVSSLRSAIRTVGRDAVKEYDRNRAVWRAVADSVLDGKSEHHAAALELEPRLDWNAALSVVRGAYGAVQGVKRDRKTGRPLGDVGRMNLAKGQFLDFPLPLLDESPI